MIRLKDGITESEMKKYGFMLETYKKAKQGDVSAAYMYDTNGSIRTTIWFIERPRHKGVFYLDGTGVVDWPKFEEVFTNIVRMTHDGVLIYEP